MTPWPWSSLDSSNRSTSPSTRPSARSSPVACSSSFAVVVGQLVVVGGDLLLELLAGRKST